MWLLTVQELPNGSTQVLKIGDQEACIKAQEDSTLKFKNWKKAYTPRFSLIKQKYTLCKIHNETIVV